MNYQEADQEIITKLSYNRYLIIEINDFVILMILKIF